MNSTAESLDVNNNVKGSSISKLKIFPWLVCGLGGLFYAYEYFLRITPNVVYADLYRFFGITAAGYGIINAFYYFAYTPMQLPVGMLMDRFGPRKLLSLACLVCAMGAFLFAKTDLWGVALVGRFLIGFGSAFAFVGVLKLATIWLPPERFGMISGMTSALGTLIGAVFGQLALAGLVNAMGWRSTVMVSSAMGIVLAIVIFLVVRDVNKRTENKDANYHETNKVQTMSEVISGFVDVLKNKYMWVNGAIGCLLYLPASGFAESWEKPYLVAAHNFTSMQADYAVSLVFLGFTIGGPLFGLLSDVIRRRNMPMMVGGICAAIFIALVLYVPNLSMPVLYTLLFLFGVSYGAQCIVFAVGRELSSLAAAATAIAVTNMFVMLSGSIFEPMIGLFLKWGWDGVIVNHEHVYSAADYRIALSMLPVFCLLGAFLVGFLKETRCKLLNAEPS